MSIYDYKSGPAISRTGSHAVRALAALAALPEGSYAGAAWIAAAIKAPSNYLGKLLRQLARAGLVTGRKGSGGGFRLARAASDVTLLDILDPVEHVLHARACFLGRTQCSHRDPCALHARWSAVRDDYLDFLKTTKLSEVAATAA
jgi:Rrf2 family transcriptional regulator, iron-sulfur cluster assembly transcription factor